MTRKFRLLAIVLLVFLVSLACSEAGSSPPGAESPAPPTSTAATQPSLPPDSSRPTPTAPAAGGLPVPPDLEIVRVASVVDGDTIELTNGRRVRYIGINTPERGQPFYDEARRMNERLVSGLRVGLERDQESFDQYGRILAYVWANGEMVNLRIVQEGFANVFTVPPNVKYDTDFRAAEQEARQAGRGLWAASEATLKITHIEANAPGSDSENPNGEWVEIVNQGDRPVPMQGYSLKDEANHIYTFGDFTLAGGASFRLHSGQGRDTGEVLYWGLVNESVWNNDSDTAFLRDAAGALVDVFSY